MEELLSRILEHLQQIDDILKLTESEQQRMDLYKAQDNEQCNYFPSSINNQL